MKLLFLDLDDTLLCSDKSISDNNLDAIRKLNDAGGGIVLATGRPLYSVMKLAEKYGILGEKYYIAAFNGGQIIDTKSMEELYHAGLDRQIARLIFNEAGSWSVTVQTYTDEYVLVEEETEFIKWYCDRIKMPYRVVPDAIGELDSDPFKCVAGHMNDQELLREFQSHILPKLPESVNNIFSNPHILEFGPLNASKGIAVSVLCDRLGVDIKDTVAVGDEENDVSMLKTAGLGVAMVNGTKSAKRCADTVTENDNDHDAVAEVIYKYMIR